MERIRLTASEEMSFENVDGRTTDGRTDGRTTDGRRMPLYTISSPVSLRLRSAKNITFFHLKIIIFTALKNFSVLHGHVFAIIQETLFSVSFGFRVSTVK